MFKRFFGFLKTTKRVLETAVIVIEFVINVFKPKEKFAN